MTSAQKMERWNNLKLRLFQHIFGQLYSARIVNLVTTTELCLTGQRYFLQEYKNKKVSNPKSK